MLLGGREGEREGVKSLSSTPPGAARKSECMTLESDHDQGKPMSPMLTEPLSVPLNNGSITLGNAGPSRIEKKIDLISQKIHLGTLLVKGKQAVEGLISDDVERGNSLINTGTLSWTLSLKGPLACSPFSSSWTEGTWPDPRDMCSPPDLTVPLTEFLIFCPKASKPSSQGLCADVLLQS